MSRYEQRWERAEKVNVAKWRCGTSSVCVPAMADLNWLPVWKHLRGALDEMEKG